MKIIVANRRGTTILLNMTKVVVDLRDPSRPTKTLSDLSRFPLAYVRDSQRFMTTITIVLNRGQNLDSMTGALWNTFFFFSTSYSLTLF